MMVLTAIKTVLGSQLNITNLRAPECIKIRITAL